MTNSKAGVVFVLVLVQTGMIALATLGELLFMGGIPFYVIMPAFRIILLLVFGTLTLRGSRTGMVGLIVLQGLSVGGLLLSTAVGLLPQVDFTPTLTGLFSSLVLPVIVGFYCVQMIYQRESVA